jgi:hypothetical protein
MGLRDVIKLLACFSLSFENKMMGSRLPVQGPSQSPSNIAGLATSSPALIITQHAILSSPHITSSPFNQNPSFKASTT